MLALRLAGHDAGSTRSCTRSRRWGWAASRRTTRASATSTRRRSRRSPIVFMLIAEPQLRARTSSPGARRSPRAYARDPEARLRHARDARQRRCSVAVFLLANGVYPTSARRCATPRSTSSRSRRPPASPTPTTTLWPIFAPVWMLFLCVLRDLLRLDRRRHQDDPRADARSSRRCASSRASSTRARSCR